MSIDDLLAALDEQAEIMENIAAAELSGELTLDKSIDMHIIIYR